ncbi:MAG: ATP-dependent sacrificial sulfur transferase LarE [Desulfobulbaceae bacterium]|nr:ATP-dependent sacrificial sulfur transferase LarE [Desulfobulbaceae bacterium]
MDKNDLPQPMILAEEKYSELIQILEKHDRLHVAFSGGIDSTLLLFAAIHALGISKVTAVNVVSTLNSRAVKDNLRQVVATNFNSNVQLKELKVDPLSWQEFVQNSHKRCYFCKKKMYSTILDSLAADGCVLADGTNVDDLGEERPGLLAIKELEVATPLVAAELNKSEIRYLAKERGLSNYSLPSNSCLATRIAGGQPVTEKSLRLIEQAEEQLEQLGFVGNRVRLIGDYVIIEVLENDVASVIDSPTRELIVDALYSLGFLNVSLSLKGR